MASQKIEEMKAAYKTGGAEAARKAGEAYDAGKTSTTTTATPKNTNTTAATTTTTPRTTQTYNVTSNSSNNAKVGTGAVASMPTQQNTQLQQQDTSTDRMAKAWNGLDYNTQQERLKSIKGLGDALAQKGITNKTEPEPTTQTTTTTPTTKTTTTKAATPKQQEWDYQDNSQARMDEIANNLDKYRQTQPGLFEDASAFYTFFIDGKGRSQDQIDYLWDYFNRVQKFSKYDNLPASTIGDMLVNGKLGDDYLNYLKANDPQKYQEALSYRQDGEDTIKYESYLSDVADEAGLGGFQKFYKEVYGYEDVNNDKIDDALYVPPTEEELTKQNRVNTIDSRIMEIKNMEKNLLDDLVEQYPGVPKATLMGIVQDRTKDLQREYDDLMVERTGLVGNIEYMQNERNAQMDARQNTINNTSKALGMYYQYSPEGISELAQSEYAATNITLDQADQGTDTQKQMALERVLTPLYDKYGSIIQRSQAQVINDVMALANQKGISLADAFEENFMSQLRNKPEFKTLSSGGSLTADKWAKLNDNTLYNVTTGEIMSTKGGGATTTSKTLGGATITPITSSTNEATTNKIMTNYQYGSTYANGQCGELMNLDASMSGSNIHFGSELADKTKWINRETYEGPQIGDYVVFDWTDKPGANESMKKYGHVGKIVGIEDGNLLVYNQNGTLKGKVSVDRYPLKDYEKYIAGYVDPTQTESYGYWGSPLDEAFSAIRQGEGNLNKDQKEALDFADSAYMMMYNLASNADIDYFLRSEDGQRVLSNYASAQFSNNASYTEDQILNVLKNKVTDPRILRIVNDLMTIIEKKLRWTSGAAISGSEWNSNSKMLIPQAGENYNTQFRKFQTFEGEYLKKPFDNMKQYAGVDVEYIPLFDGKSPYYKKHIVSAEKESDDIF